MSAAQRIAERVVKAAARATAKQLIRPPIPFTLQRRIVAILTASTVKPKGLDIGPAVGAPVPTERVVPQTGGAERTIIFLHGGAYVTGSPTSYRPITGGMALNAAAEVFAPDYRLAPEHPYPAALDDALATYQWVLEEGVDPSQITIAGDSAGGGLALSAAIAIRDQDLPLPGALFLIAPWVDLTLGSETHSTVRKREVVLNHRWLEQAVPAYAGETAREDPGISPLFADHSGLPPTLIHVGSEEVLIGDSQALTERMREAGVDVELAVFDGLWHDFHLHAPLLRRSTEAIEAAAGFIRANT